MFDVVFHALYHVQTVEAHERHATFMTLAWIHNELHETHATFMMLAERHRQ